MKLCSLTGFSIKGLYQPFVLPSHCRQVHLRNHLRQCGQKSANDLLLGCQRTVASIWHWKDLALMSSILEAWERWAHSTALSKLVSTGFAITVILEYPFTPLDIIGGGCVEAACSFYSTQMGLWNNLLIIRKDAAHKFTSNSFSKSLCMNYFLQSLYKWKRDRRFFNPVGKFFSRHKRSFFID